MEEEKYKIGYLADITSDNPEFEGMLVFSNNPSSISSYKDMLATCSGVNLGGGYQEDAFTISDMRRIKYFEEE